MKIRYGICLVMSMAMMIVALPYLTFEGRSEEVWFSALWLAFAYIVIAGNLSGLLFSRRKKGSSARPQGKSLVVQKKEYKRVH